MLQVGEAALTAAILQNEAKSRGLRWDHLPVASRTRTLVRAVAVGERALRGAMWLSRLRIAAHSHDIVHIHSATTAAHSRLVAPRYVLHCHGSDVRTAQYAQRSGASVRRALDEAEAVFFSTPDLVEHVLPRRPDAVYLPVPVAVVDLPNWRPDPEHPRVAFASRWEDVKGLNVQLNAARRIIAAVGEHIEVAGLDWGPGADAAAANGVHMVRRMSHPLYLEWLATSTVVIGQAAGILSASELEAMGVGVPLLVPAPLVGYDGLASSDPPVLGHDIDSVVEMAAHLIKDATGHAPASSREWVAREHGAQTSLDRVLSVHDEVLVNRGCR